MNRPPINTTSGATLITEFCSRSDKFGGQHVYPPDKMSTLREGVYNTTAYVKGEGYVSTSS